MIMVGLWIGSREAQVLRTYGGVAMGIIQY
jgi:hypothetical protein